MPQRWAQPSWPNGSPPLTPHAAPEASIGPGRPFPSHLPRTTGWAACVRTPGAAPHPRPLRYRRVACTGVHGANRLASNSLLESLVFAWRCAELLLQENVAKVAAEFFALSRTALRSRCPCHNTFPRNIAAPVDRLALQTLMWNAAGIERTASGLEAAATQLDQWRASGDTIQDLETANLLSLARVLVAAALARCESRGAHFREDFPETSADFQRSLVYSQAIAKAAPVGC